MTEQTNTTSNEQATDAPDATIVTTLDDPRVSKRLSQSVDILRETADEYNEVMTRATAGEKSVDEIAETLAQTSDDPKVVSLREKIAAAQENLLALVRQSAEDLKKSAPVVTDDEKREAKTLLKEALSMVTRYEEKDGVKVQHLITNLPDDVSSRKSAGKSAGAPTKAAPRGLTFFVNGEESGTAAAAAKVLKIGTADVLNTYAAAIGIGDQMTHAAIEANPQKDWPRETEYAVGDNKVRVVFDPAKTGK